MTLGEKIKAARKEKGMTQSSLCAEKITRNMLSEIECGNYRTLDLQKAKDEAKKYLDILNSREQTFKYN